MSTDEGIEAGAKGGCYAGIAFGFLAVLGLVVMAFQAHSNGATPLLIAFISTAPAFEAAIGFVAAYRFRYRKGLAIGSIALVLFLIEIVFKITHGAFKPGWTLAYVAIVAGFVNGLRAAWATRRAPSLNDAQLEGIFD
ncbi:MAG TPA: hypothetical protein VK533_04410 [Sphingomonas sp.]|uniref:hypothetical protein n=1 Tax=Sphingomonas sp. TaxID=28214 RepID=UPI002C28A0BF|nr:hypothetical protein [Sphingomonas sp.]HMI18767.1 hypothetical protein [Sphingomonas sp.]